VTSVGKEDDDRIHQKSTLNKHRLQYKDPHFAVEVTSCFIADKIHVFNPALVKIQLLTLREKAVETTEYIRNYTINHWSAPMDEKSVQLWDKRPNISHLMLRAHRIIYMPLSYATKFQPEIEGVVDEEQEIISDGPTEWLIRRPFR